MQMTGSTSPHPHPANSLSPPRIPGQAPVPEGGQWVGWSGAVCGPGVGGHSWVPRAEATRQREGPSSHPLNHLTIGPRAPPEVQAQTHIL